MSRALGDLQYKNPLNTIRDDSAMSSDRRAFSSSKAVRGDFLSNEPYTSRRTLHHERRYVLVAISDGVSDRTDDAALMQHVMKLAIRGMRASEIAQNIVKTSGRHARSDNASCIVAMLDGQRS